MTGDRSADRLDASTYEDDDDTVGIFESSPEEPEALWLSARLFHRLTAVASAYELHTLPALHGVDIDRLNRARCEGLLDELAFVADRLNDALAVRTAQTISDFVALRLRRPNWAGPITFEGDSNSVLICRRPSDRADERSFGRRAVVYRNHRDFRSPRV